MITVLVVDDTDSIRRGLSLLLKHAGYDPITAADGYEAMEVLDACRPDLILLDIAMPGVDGLTVLEHVRSRPDLASIPVMIYSANDDSGVRQRVARLGAEFVEKGTVRWDELAPRIGGRVSVNRVATEAASYPANHL